MRDNRFITKLIGLLYIAFLVLFGTNIPVLASQRTDGTVDTKPVSVALAEKDVRLSAGTYATGASELTLVLQPADRPLLEDFDRLQVLDASGSTCYAELIAWGQQHPEVELRYSVPLPDGTVVDNTVQALSLEWLTADRISELLDALT